MARTLLSESELQEELASLPGWHGDTRAIERTVEVSDVDGFLRRLEAIAREMDHDPATAVDGSEVTVTMTTHSAAGVTELDVAYAHRVEELLG